jgi:hypothetical protein
MAVEAGIGIRLFVRRPHCEFPIVKDLDCVRRIGQMTIDWIVAKVDGGVRHEILRILLHLEGMAGRTILRCNDHMDGKPIMLEGVFVLLGVQHVAFCAANDRFDEIVRDLVC